MFKKIKKLLSNISIEDIVIFIIPIVLIGFMLYIYYPGIYNFDVFNQLKQINSGEFVTGHPFISTFYLMIFHKFIGISVALPIFQILWFSLLCTLICKYTRKENNKLNFIIQILLVIFISINPLISLSVISNNKDSLFFLIFITIIYLLWIVIDKKFICRKTIYVLLAFFMVFFSNIRHNGFYVNCLFLIVFISILIFKTIKEDKKIIMFFCGSLVLSILIFNIPKNFYTINGNDMNAQSVGSLKALQFDGYLYNEKKMNDLEIKKLDEFVNVKSLSEHSFNYAYMDPIISVEKKELYNNSKEFFKYNLRVLANHKIDGIKFYFASAPIIWNIYLPENIMHSYVWLDINVPNRIENINYKNRNTNIFKKIDSFFRKIQNGKGNKAWISIFYSPAMYMYFSIIITILIMILKNKNIWLLTFYNLLNVAIISISIPVQDVRYLLNGHGLFMVLALILLGVLFEKKKEY